MRKEIALVLVSCTILTGCFVPQPPKNVDNICSIFREYPRWHARAKATERRWHIPVAVQMAIIHQESKFNGTAKPERTKLLWVIPWNRPSSAYGYSQALDGTWDVYKKNRGRYFSSRDSFADATDFIGWYANQAYIKGGIEKSNAYELYLAYHEGIGGYSRKSYLQKLWLIKVAQKVERRARIYEWQLEQCS